MAIRRRDVVVGAGAMAVGAALSGTRAQAADTKPVRIGYSLSKSGPYAPGAQLSQAPNYDLWIKLVNEQGGLEVKGEGRRPIEVITIDDESKVDKTIQYYTDLMTKEKVDLVLPPWGTHLNFEISPLVEKHGYPLLCPTVSANRIEEMKLNYVYVLLSQPKAIVQTVSETLAELVAKQQIKNIGVAYVADLFGLDFFKVFADLSKKLKLPVVHSERYALNAKQFEGVLTAMQKKSVDAFVAFSYPGDTFGLTKTAKAMGWNPPFFFTSVGTAFPAFRDANGGAEGVLGIGGWNKNAKGAKEYFDLHLARQGKEPERWASAHAWAGLKILEQCIREVGLDRQKIKQHLDTQTFETIVGPVRFTHRINRSTPGTLGQWQKGQFEIVAPASAATAPMIVPKPTWG